MTNLWKQAQTASGKKVLRAWVTATVLGMWLGYIVADVLVLLILGWLTSSTQIVALYALISGLMRGACQWIVLRRYFKKAYWWIVATVLGNFLAAILLMPLLNAALLVFADPSVWDIAPLFESVAANDISQALATGVGVGIAQWLYLRTRLPKTSVWIAVVVGSAVLSLVVWLVPIPQFQSPESGIQGFSGIIQPSWQGQLMLTAFYFARLGLEGIIQAGITGIWLTDFVTRKQA